MNGTSGYTGWYRFSAASSFSSSFHAASSPTFSFSFIFFPHPGEEKLLRHADQSKPALTVK